jgi:transposase
VAQSFIACDRDQAFFMPPDVRDWLAEGHLAWFVVDAVAAMDLAAFMRPIARTAAAGLAYEPSMMVALLLYAYARGVRSSRAIERACEEDVAYRVIAAHTKPDHATIARFVERHEQALAGLFGAVLELCAQAGLAKVGIVAIDGIKVAANASRDATRDHEQIAREILEEAKAVDAAEDELYGDARGDELPPELASAQGRKKWLRAWQRQLDDQRAKEARPVPRSRPDRLKEAKRRLEQELSTEGQANAAYEAYLARGVMKNGRRFGAPPKPYEPPTAPQGKINLTEPDSRLVKGMRGWLQGYNAQAATNDQQIVIAAEITVDSPDFGHLEPVLDAARSELRAAGVTDTPDVVLADAGYWHQDQMQRIVADGTQVLIPPDSSRRKAPRPGWDGGLYAFMRRVLNTERGTELYRQRQQLIEPVFAHTKFNRRIDRFHRRGRSAV